MKDTTFTLTEFDSSFSDFDFRSQRMEKTELLQPFSHEVLARSRCNFVCF